MRFRSSLFMAAAMLALSAATTPGARAATMENHWYIAPFAGYHVFDGDWGTRLYGRPGLEAKEAFHAGARLGWLSANGFGFELAGGWSSTKLDSSGADVADLTWMHGSANLVYQPPAGSFGAPFLSAGFGAGQADHDGDVAPAAAVTDPGDDKINLGVLTMAAGWYVPLGERMGLRAEARNLLWIPKEDFENTDVAQQVYGGALVFNFGGTPKDDDLDGVPNRKDKCPDTPKGATVDATGCPSDADGDVVLDGLDQCPDTPKGARVDSRGCPTDADGDGVWDGLDQCADTPKGAAVDERGCSRDSDGDGVVDGIDRCENTPKGARVDETGCPMDPDGDGVPAGLDKCPDTPAGLKVDKDGCPIEITERETELLDTGIIRLENVNFETAKADILPESHATLDIVGQLLSKWPQLQIEIGGHTDSRGSASYNQQLSEARANAVMSYLTGKFPGLKPSQFTAKGYGESNPVAPNTSAASMAKNRRVEFVVLNKDVLKKERESRRLLEK